MAEHLHSSTLSASGATQPIPFLTLEQKAAFVFVLLLFIFLGLLIRSTAARRGTSPLRAHAFKTTWTHLRAKLRKVQNRTCGKQISLEKTDQAWRTAALLSSAAVQTEEIPRVATCNPADSVLKDVLQ
ncbi:hypothetical protein AOLI_G00052180 [Acnodon oligacanthus]